MARSFLEPLGGFFFDLSGRKPSSAAAGRSSKARGEPDGSPLHGISNPGPER
jgi:hypothetical protein